MNADSTTTATRPDLDAITVLRTLDGKPCNKIITRAADGTIRKQMAPNSGEFAAQTVPCPDLQTLAAVLTEIGGHPDHLISLGLYRAPPAEPFLILPMAELAQRVGCDPGDRAKLAGWHPVGSSWACARMKENVAPSSFILFDRDIADGMPEALAQLTHEAWLRALDLLLPGIASCGHVHVPSSSTRVLVDGVPLQSESGHTYVQVTDPDDIARAWPQAAMRALITSFEPAPWGDPIPLAFAKPIKRKDTGEVAHRVWWTIFDKSVMNPERLIFAGAPVVRGAGLDVGAPGARHA